MRNCHGCRHHYSRWRVGQVKQRCGDGDIHIGGARQEPRVQPMGPGMGEERLGQEDHAGMTVATMAMAAPVQRTCPTEGEADTIGPRFLKTQDMDAIPPLGHDKGAQDLSIPFCHKDMTVENVVRVVRDHHLPGELSRDPGIL